MSAKERLEGALWESLAAVSWVEKNVPRAVDEGLGAADADEITSHLDAAHEDLFAPLTLVCPWVGDAGREVDEDACRAAGAARMRLADVYSGDVLSAVCDLMRRTRGLFDEMLVDLAELGADDDASVARMQDAHRGLESVTQSVDAILMVLDASHAGTEIRATIDPDERIATASRQERTELHREQTRATNAHFDALARASAKLIAFHDGRRRRYAELRPRLEAVTPSTAGRVISDLRGLGLQVDEAAALVGMFMIGARTRARST